VTVSNRLPSGTAQSSGSGFVIDSARGYIVTNNHVIENVSNTDPGASFDVIFSDNRVVKNAKLIGRDDKTDVAILQVPAQGLKAAALANSDSAPVGTTVAAIGSALGQLQNTVTTGIEYNLLTPRLAASLSLPSDTQGVIISQILPGSPAAQSGLKVNDVITKINTQQIDGAHPITLILLHTRPGDKVTLTIIRDGKQQTVDLTLGRQS